ncbi:unnamed protein product [Caenorhabditis nigoni]
MSSLSEMPELVLENIVGISDFRSVLTLRQVCRGFRNFIDKLNDSKLPDAKIIRIQMAAHKNKDISLYYKELDGSEHTFTYSEVGKYRKFNGKTTNLENSNILDVAIRDLEFVLRFQRLNLDLLDLLLNDSQPPNGLSIDTSPVKLGNMFQKLNRKIRTRSLRVKTDSQPNIMSILPFIEPETLEVLDLQPLIYETEIEINDIVKTEQWKKVKNIYFHFLPSNLNVEVICHFQKNSMKLLTISARELDILRKIFVSPSNFKNIWLYVNNFNEKKELAKYWGAAFIHRPGSCWYFRMKDFEENVLRICIEKYRETTISFDIIQLTDVPTIAVVHAYNEN